MLINANELFDAAPLLFKKLRDNLLYEIDRNN